MKNAARRQGSPKWDRQTPPFLHMLSSFSSCHSVWCFFSSTFHSSRACKVLENSFAAGTPISINSSQLPSLQHLPQILLNAYKKKKETNPGCSKWKQKAHWCRRERSCPPSRRAETSCKIMLTWEKGRNKNIKRGWRHANTMTYEDMGEFRNSSVSCFTDLRPKTRAILFRGLVSPCSQQALTSLNSSLGCPFIEAAFSVGTAAVSQLSCPPSGALRVDCQHAHHHWHSEKVFQSLALEPAG